MTKSSNHTFTKQRSNTSQLIIQSSWWFISYQLVIMAAVQAWIFQLVSIYLWTELEFKSIRGNRRPRFFFFLVCSNKSGCTPSVKTKSPCLKWKQGKWTQRSVLVCSVREALCTQSFSYSTHFCTANPVRPVKLPITSRAPCSRGLSRCNVADLGLRCGFSWISNKLSSVCQRDRDTFMSVKCYSAACTWQPS